MMNDHFWGIDELKTLVAPAIAELAILSCRGCEPGIEAAQGQKAGPGHGQVVGGKKAALTRLPGTS